MAFSTTRRFVLPAAGVLLFAFSLIAAFGQPLLRQSSKPEASGREEPEHDPASPAELERACQEVAREFDGRLGLGHAVLVRSPFVLAGDVSQQQLDELHATVIAPLVAAMTRSYGLRSSDEPVLLLLFGSETHYRLQARRLFGDRKVSSFGYYKPGRRAVLVNLAAGHCGLRHELTHALLEFDYPDAPQWLDEGLASLHEACRLNPASGRLVGRHNWRLPILQQALADGQTPPLEDFTAPGGFQKTDEATAYALARYLCLFLQDQGRLEQVYMTMRETGRPGVEWLELDVRFRRWMAGHSLLSRSERLLWDEGETTSAY